MSAFDTNKRQLTLLIVQHWL